MAKDERTIGQRLSEAAMVFGDGMQGIYGQRGNTYATYLDAQTKRQALEAEAEKYQQQQAMETYKQQTGLYEKQQDSITKYAQMGMRPIDPMQAQSPSGRMPARMTQGAYGQSYVPSSIMGTTPIFGIGDGGGIQQMGSMPKGGKFVSPASMTTPAEKEASALRVATAKNELPTADMKNAVVSTQQFGALVKDLKAQAYSLEGGYSGIAESGKAFVNRGKGKSADYLAYNGSMPTAAVGIYRGLTGDNRLSDSDAKARALPLMWNPSEHPDVRDKKFAFLERMGAAREKLLSSGKYKPDKDGNIVIPLEDLKKAAQGSIFKEGDIRKKDGKDYVRQKDGSWLPK